MISVYYFLVVSDFIFIFEVSDIIFDVSIIIFDVSLIFIVVESVVLIVVESVVFVDEPELLQATIIVAAERMAKIFFMTSCFKGLYNWRKGNFFSQMTKFLTKNYRMSAYTQ